jgi:cell division protein FtsI/penicillin-binding protein 2
MPDGSLGPPGLPVSAGRPVPPRPAMPAGLQVPVGPPDRSGPFTRTDPAATAGMPVPPSPPGPGSPVPGEPGADFAAPAAPAARAGTRASTGPRSARHVVPPVPAKTGGKSSPASRRARRSRIAAIAIVVVGVLVIGFAVGFGTDPSAEPTAQAFLLDWQQLDYAGAGALTTATPKTVAADLSAAFAQVDATQLFMSMDSIVQHGGTAVASFTASVDLAEQGRVWAYHGRFGLRQVDGAWKVEWAPSVIEPNLRPGDRLAVVTAFPSRASVLDAAGNPLQVYAPVYLLGVTPDSVADPAATARAFASATGLEAAQVLGQISAAPPSEFLRLASLDPATYAGLRSRLASVPGLVVKLAEERLFQAKATGLVGQVGSEVDPVLRADGTYYLPGTTVGLTGLEAAYQRQLIGSPTTKVVIVNSASKQTSVLAQWLGAPGTPVHTTISAPVQDAALTALAGEPNSAEIVAVQSTTGQVLAVAQHQASGALPAAGPLDAKLTPGTAFTVVSAAALLGTGLKLSTQISCENSFTVGGQTFTSDGTGELKPFSAEFADDCGTVFAGLSERLNASKLARVVKEFGIGADWSQLQVPAFSGSVPFTSVDADLAAETIGQGNVQVSPLSMAMVAAAVDSGSWHTPQFIENPADPAINAGTALDPGTLPALRSLMLGAVRSGAASAADLAGVPVYGQVGLVKSRSGWTSWFVGFRGDIAFTIIESGKTSQLSAASLAAAFLSAIPG